MRNPTLPDYKPTSANKRYAANSLGTWSSISDIDVFLSRFTHENDYKDGNTELALGNYVTIQDGTYNTSWMIAGFDMEYNQLDADGNRYDNGLGICMIPQTYVIYGKWNVDTVLTGAYKSSYVNTTLLPTVVNNLQNVLGSHIVNRNVLLSSNIDGSYHSNAYTWTTAYATLMNVGQITGAFAANNNRYDDGEANYKLPIFDHKGYKIGDNFWLRNVWGRSGGTVRAWIVGADGILNNINFGNVAGIRPLIYLR